MKRKTRKKSRRAFVANPRKKRRHASRRRTYRSNPAPRMGGFAHRRRTYRSNPSMSIMDIAKLLISATIGAILLPFAAGRLPEKVATAKNPLLMAAGAFLIWKFHKKAPWLAALGLGGGLIGLRNIVINKVPTLAGSSELSEDEMTELLGYSADGEFDGEDDEFDGEDDEFDGEDEGGDFMSGPLNGPLNGPLE